MLQKLYVGVAVLMGVAAEANGLFMLASPADWYLSVPGVTTTGPFNQHHAEFVLGTTAATEASRRL